MPYYPATESDRQLLAEILPLLAGKQREAERVALTIENASRSWGDPGDGDHFDPAGYESEIARSLWAQSEPESERRNGTLTRQDALRVMRAFIPDHPGIPRFEWVAYRERAERLLEGNDREVARLADELQERDRADRLSAPRHGGAFIFGRTDTPVPLWGDRSAPLWVAGESLMIFSDTGIGKTTLAGQIIRAQLFGDTVIGQPVKPVRGRILYLAMDRPEQIGRSMARQFRPEHAETLDKQLVVRPGPLSADLAEEPALLAGMARKHDAEVIYLDSLKDAALGLSDDRAGAAYNQARQQALRDGRQLCELHHTTKNGAASYGSAWLLAGAGSAIQLEGKRGRDTGRLVHVKQPAAEVGPLALRFDRPAGEIYRDHGGDDSASTEAADVDLVALAVDGGVTARQAAEVLHRTARPTPGQITQAHRELDRRVETGQLRRSENAGPRGAVAWVPA
jgi:replicative DNA helicase